MRYLLIRYINIAYIYIAYILPIYCLYIAYILPIGCLSMLCYPSMGNLFFLHVARHLNSLCSSGGIRVAEALCMRCSAAPPNIEIKSNMHNMYNTIDLRYNP